MYTKSFRFLSFIVFLSMVVTPVSAHPTLSSTSNPITLSDANQEGATSPSITTPLISELAAPAEQACSQSSLGTINWSAIDNPPGPEPAVHPQPSAFLGVAPAAPTRPAEATGGGIASLSGSQVIFDGGAHGYDSCYMPGMAQTFCFEAESYTNDWEYVYNVWEKFPSDWTVTNVFVEGTPYCTGTGSWGSFSWSFHTSPYEVNIYHPRYQGTTDSCFATYCFEVIPGAGAFDLPVSWYWAGDGWGSPPHRPCSDDNYTPSGQPACDEAINPTADIPPCAYEPGIYLIPEIITASGCNGVEQIHDLKLLNASGYAGEFDLEYTLLEPAYGTISGPQSIYAEDGEFVEFEFTLTPEICLPDGVVIEGSILAYDENYSDITTIYKTISTGTFWEQIATEPDSGRMDNVVAAYDGRAWSITGYGANANVRYYTPAADSWTTVPTSTPPFGVNYARSGCQVDDTVYIFGDSTTSGFTGLWAYNLDANTWTSLSPGGTAPPYTGIWAPAWAYSQETGHCYLTGGATTPGGGNLTTVFVYDPDSNVWMPQLPNFSSTRAFHAAWTIGEGADHMLCVAGGVDVNSVVHSNTECYHFDTYTWGAPNGDIPALPLGLWGMGYTEINPLSGSQLWMVGGADSDFMLHYNTYYYDVALGVWETGGPWVTSPAYRLSATSLDNKVYKLGGSTGGFNYTGLADRQESCPECTQLGYLEGHVYDYDGISPPGTPAYVHLEPGNITIPVDEYGFYSIALVPFVYEATASAVDYPEEDGPYEVVILADTITEQDFILDRPDIEVEPLAITVEIPYGETDAEIMTIFNLGTLDLDFEIFEIPVGASAAGPPSDTYRQVPQVIGVDPQIYADMDASVDGKAGFFIAFAETADLTPAYSLSWGERGHFVVAALKAAAEAAQGRVQAWLIDQGIESESYWINNSLFIEGDLATLEALAAFPEVSGFMANRTYHVMPVEYNLEIESGITQPAYPWNVIFPKADQVHTELGLTGSGIVVAGVDTGVEYTHIGLVENYRGNLGGGVFDHTYSWFNPGTDECGGGLPCDTDGHGTRTHGIMAGDDDPSLPSNAWIGMSPDAQWIHCLGLPYGSGSDTELNACAQWFLAPGGDPDMRPHVVNNSWGSWSPNDCGGNWYAPALQAYRAADIVPAFAAGNVGDYVTPPHCNSSTPPANNTDPDGNPLAFASGAHGSGGLLDYYSSGGPNACNPEKLFPDIASPGLGSCTTNLNNGYYCGFGGTSAASPHTAGCVALVRQAAPSLSVAQVEQAIRDGATYVDDLACGGSVEWNNKYGNGWLDCYTAVSAVYAFDIPWLATNPTAGSVPPDEQVVVDVLFDAGEVDDPGEYSAILKVRSNDPVDQAVDVLVTMIVIAPEDIGLLEGTVTSLGYCDEDPAPLEGTEVLIESNLGESWVVTTDSEGYYYRWLSEEGNPYTVTVSADEHAGEIAEGVIIIGQETTTVDFDLRWLKPCLSADPLAFDVEVAINHELLVELTLINAGGGDADFTIQKRPDGSIPLGSSGEVLEAAPSIPAEVFTGTIPPGYQPQAVGETSIPTGPWQTLASAPFVSMDNVYVSYENMGYLVGGYGANGQVGIYNADTNSWTTGATEPTPRIQYPVDGCFGFDAGGDPVAVLFPDTTSGVTTLHRYNIATNSWDTPPVPAGFPANGLWAHDITSIYPYTGENVCYISGGATTPGGGNTSALYAYYPDTNTIVNQGNYSHLSLGFAFHASWFVPWVGSSGGICVGGGVNVNSEVTANTQCYDIAGAVFNAVNADLGTMPAGLWGMADGMLYEGGDYQLWVAQGADAAFALWPNSAYFSESSGQWHIGPTPPRTGYRVEGTNIEASDGFSFYVVGGSSGGFTPTNGHERNYSSEFPPPPIEILWLSVDPTEGLVPADDTFSVDVTFTALEELEVGETYYALLR
ncbi:MAG: S8 family serine peptidase, partial [Anaerolineales bacterium]